MQSGPTASPLCVCGKEFGAEVDEIAANGDTETQNALEALQAAADELASDPSTTKLLEARDDLRVALDDLAARCKAVGSSVLK